MASAVNAVCVKVEDLDVKVKKEEQVDNLLQLPSEILTMIIGKFIEHGDSYEAARNVVRFGRVCALAHAVSETVVARDAKVAMAIQSLVGQRVLNIFMSSGSPCSGFLRHCHV